MVWIVAAYLVVVLYARANYGVDSELTLFNKRRCSHCVMQRTEQWLVQSLRQRQIVEYPAIDELNRSTGR